MEFQRDFAIKIIQEKLDANPVVAILGPRQIGKTTLAKQFLNQTNGVYLDLESPSDIQKIEDAESYLIQRENQLVVIDEIQRMPELFPILRSAIDRNRKNGRFILVGSASPNLLAKSSETLAGRISFYELPGVQLSEVQPHQSSDLWLKGGYPNFFIEPNQSFEKRIDYLNTFIERELPALGVQMPRRPLRNLVNMLGQLNGNLFNISELSRSLGQDHRQINHALEYLDNGYLIRFLHPYFSNINKRLVKSRKLYFRDTGLLHALFGVDTREDLEGFIGRGGSFETFVINQTLPWLKPGIESHFYRTQDGAEIDLLLVKGQKPVLGMEIKTSNAPKLSRGTTVASEALGNIPLIVVTPSLNEDYHKNQNTIVTSVERILEHLKVYDLCR